MEIILLVTLLLLILGLVYKKKKKKGCGADNLPPSLPLFSLLAAILKISWPSAPSLADINHLLHHLQSSRGPITSLRLPFNICTTVFISDSDLANQILINNASAVSDRFRPSTPFHSHGPEHAGVTISPYGETWRSLRRNLVSGFVQQKQNFAAARRRAVEKLLQRFASEAAESAAGGGIVNFRKNVSPAFYNLLASMCFGRDLNDRDCLLLHRTMNSKVSASAALIFFSFLPGLIQKLLVFCNSRLLLNSNNGGILFDLLKSRTVGRDTCYAASLFEFEFPGGKRKLSEDEILDLCAEFVGASGHNTTIALEWIMAELVNNPHVQGKLAEELLGRDDEDDDDDGMTGSMYLRAVVMEGIRLHPPTPSFVRFVGKEFEVGGYAVPKGALVFFNAAAMGVEQRVWGEEALKFLPERFVAAAGGGEHPKLMAFGGGRRMCAGSESAVFVLSYFVGHLVREFEWKPGGRGGDHEQVVDMAANMEFFMQMKTPLRPRIVRRRRTTNF